MTAIQPIEQSERLAVLDFLRGFALFGIMFVNMTWFTGFAVMSAAERQQFRTAGLDGVEDLEGLNPAQILAWTGTREERPALWSALRQAGIEVQFGTLGAEGRRRDDRYAADGDVSEYRDLFRQGVTVIATDTPLAVQSVLGAEVAKAAACRRPR